MWVLLFFMIFNADERGNISIAGSRDYNTLLQCQFAEAILKKEIGNDKLYTDCVYVKTGDRQHEKP